MAGILLLSMIIVSLSAYLTGFALGEALEEALGEALVEAPALAVEGALEADAEGAFEAEPLGLALLFVLPQDARRDTHSNRQRMRATSLSTFFIFTSP
jgi:hypothetical protein